MSSLAGYVVHLHCRACGRAREVTAAALAARGVVLGQTVGWGRRLRCQVCGSVGKSDVSILPNVTASPFDR